jgi:hypothetical protein
LAYKRPKTAPPDILVFIERMAQIIEQNSHNHAQESATPSDSTAHSGDVSALPSPTGNASSLRGHLEELADRARTYVEAASSTNTRRAYASDWKHFAAWCRRQNVSPLSDTLFFSGRLTVCDLEHNGEHEDLWGGQAARAVLGFS